MNQGKCRRVSYRLDGSIISSRDLGLRFCPGEKEPLYEIKLGPQIALYLTEKQLKLAKEAGIAGWRVETWRAET